MDNPMMYPFVVCVPFELLLVVFPFAELLVVDVGSLHETHLDVESFHV